MQTFLPYPDFEKSAKVLDYRRLGKQRVETWQILMTLCGNSKGWSNHPAVKMWENHIDCLADYGIAICSEWIDRGYKDTILERILYNVNSHILHPAPSWLGNEHFHASHRSNLLRKDPTYYGQFGWTEPNDLPYYWPTKEIK